MANISDKYQYLPGVKVNYEDGNLVQGVQNLQTNTQSILLIGSAIDGPVGEPISVARLGGMKAAEKMFGGVLRRRTVEINGRKEVIKEPHQGKLIRAMYEAYRAGQQDIRLLRVSGRSAKTELLAKDSAHAFEQILGEIRGNIAYSKRLTLPSDGKLLAVEYVNEMLPDGTKKAHNVATAILNTDDTMGNETIYFAENKMVPGNQVEVSYKYMKRTYHEVLHGDADGGLTQDPAQTNYFSSTHLYWSENVALGHTINVFVGATAIPQLNGSGEYLWRPGKADATVTNELTDDYTIDEFRQGGIRFTSAYQVEVGAGTYPPLSASTPVSADYFYYDEIQMTDTTMFPNADGSSFYIPGQDKEYLLDHIPMMNADGTDSLRVYYLVGGIPTDLVEKHDDGTGKIVGDYTKLFPSASGEKMRLIVRAGAGPIGAKLTAYYKTSEKSVKDPKMIVEGRYEGSVYGGIVDPYDTATAYGVRIKIEPDPSDATGQHKIVTFEKPEEKKLTYRDNLLVFKTKELTKIRTMREFANYVNNHPMNNIVKLTVVSEEGYAGDIPVTGLVETLSTSSSGDGFVMLGQEYDVATGTYIMKEDTTKAMSDPNRYPWLGDDGFLDPNSITDMAKLFEMLGGQYDINAQTQEAKLLVNGAYSKLENYAVDVIVLLEAYANTPIASFAEDGTAYVDEAKNFATQLAQHCAVVTAKTWETIGVINAAPVKETSLLAIQQYIDELTAPGKNEHYMYNEAIFDQILNDNGERIDIGRYVNVVFGPEVSVASEAVGGYQTGGDVLYGSLITSLNPEISTTNQILPGAQGLRYRLSEAQLNQLAGGRYVTFEDKSAVYGGSTRIVVKDGVTAALLNSDYTRLSTVRITHATVQLIRKKADPFIGKPNGLAQRNALYAEIQAGLDRLKELGVLNNFKFSIFTSARDQVIGNAFITLELVPAYELRKIHTSVALRASL